MTFDHKHFLQTNEGDVLLFVYGTLRHDAPTSNCDRVAMCGGRLVAKRCRVRGRLHDFGWFPGLVLDDAAGYVTGEVWQVPVCRMALLDRYERPMYFLSDVLVESEDSGDFAAVAYVVKDAVDLTTVPVIASGDWVTP